MVLRKQKIYLAKTKNIKEGGKTTSKGAL